MLTSTPQAPVSYARMKMIMINHVEVNRHTMFQQATDSVKLHLEELTKRIETEALSVSGTRLPVCSRRRGHPLSGHDWRSPPHPREELLLLQEMKPLVECVDEAFREHVWASSR